MVDPQRGDSAGGLSVQHIGCIEAPAKADLDHAGIGGNAVEGEESRCRGHFEEAGRKVRAQVQHFLEQIGQQVVRNQFTRDANALVIADQVRLGRGMDGQPFGLQHRAQIGAGAAFAIGSGDVEHGWQGAVRIAQPREQFVYDLKPQPPARQAERAKPVQLCLDPRIVRDGEVFQMPLPPAGGVRGGHV